MKKYFVSSVITFLTGFCIVLIASWDTITLESLKSGSILGLIFMASRAGVKGVIEYYLAKHTTLME